MYLRYIRKFITHNLTLNHVYFSRSINGYDFMICGNNDHIDKKTEFYNGIYRYFIHENGIYVISCEYNYANISSHISVRLSDVDDFICVYRIPVYELDSIKYKYISVKCI